MWPFSKKKIHLVLREEYCDAKTAIMDWYGASIISALFLTVFLAMFVAKIGIWPLVPVGTACLVLIRAGAGLRMNRKIVEQYLEQERQNQLEKSFKTDD